MTAVSASSVWHVPCLHAKVYLADRSRAIVTSANLTANAFYRNVEYGLEISDAALVGEVCSDLEDLEVYGTSVALGQLRDYVEVAVHVRQSYERQQNRIDPALRRAFEEAVQNAEEELVRFRLSGAAMHTVFARTIHHLLRTRGPLPTEAIHEFVKQLHPDLCDDSVDRVIDGKHYGKKWKHAVRTAQQKLKGSGSVYLEGDLWHAALERNHER